MPTPIVWVHGDSLSPTNPALAAYPNAPAVWVWDDELLREWRISRKRIVFIYECLLELPVEIRRGHVVAEICAFAQEKGAQKVVTTSSPSPRFKQCCRELAQMLEVEVLSAPVLVPCTPDMDLQRFSRYWKVAEKVIYR
ncbi:MAG: hypothetical protein RMI89_07130 [Gloeomargarita sp. SKYBB_i_bin120]|nr:hypothetical protein [Gloeomargarita sp. SKYG98]MCS7292731.1 hypothetical protein [Gloeomargarita sp. SKYB120]MDW8178294.1 hypothetical protein [Gloeomargarita sp. SKYBB_i_bin120]